MVRRTSLPGNTYDVERPTARAGTSPAGAHRRHARCAETVVPTTWSTRPNLVRERHRIGPIRRLDGPARGVDRGGAEPPSRSPPHRTRTVTAARRPERRTHTSSPRLRGARTATNRRAGRAVHPYTRPPGAGRRAKYRTTRTVAPGATRRRRHDASPTPTRRRRTVRVRADDGTARRVRARPTSTRTNTAWRSGTRCRTDVRLGRAARVVDTRLPDRALTARRVPESRLPPEVAPGQADRNRLLL
jgi:hypothetical protein